MRILKFVLIFFIFLISISSLFIFISVKKIQSIDNFNLLILGKGGDGHTAPNLTDTIMIASFNGKTKKINILSIPRDVWITEIRAKLNTAYHYGGFEMAKSSVKSILGLSVNNVVVVDFSLFKDLIDSVGGINVKVDKSFTDEKYPIAGLENDLCNGDRTYACRYEKVIFGQGDQKMDGELALKFVRSRNAVGDEGTDLAREKRQQRVIEAIKQKIISSEVILSPKAIKNLYTVFIAHIETDLDIDTIKRLAKFAVESNFKINFLSIPENFLITSQNNVKYDKQYVFLPSSGSWAQLQEWIRNSF